MKNIFSGLVILLASTITSSVQIEQIWMTHKSHTPEKIVISWLSKNPGNSIVRFGANPSCEHQVIIKENLRLHHIEIPIPELGVSLVI